ncbi:MAG: ammonium transporter [Moorea sp. SIOASIH]|uniref:ammonium transporter n=1 Tax=Moorena sp. SIOASIH TaxID=2607817 RepID=UPI0013BE4F4B|nr:ammonium transporter [Moorena sp. SIOASIH]NEO36668.1 ammonium transporter [Moorena sp. SIOASIH]
MLTIKKLKIQKKWRLPSWKFCLPLIATILLLWAQAALGENNYNDSGEQLDTMNNTIWVLLAAFLVFFMNAGFGMLEAGFCRYKNAANILTKNLLVFSIATLAFWVLGFTLMMDDSFLGVIGGLKGLLLNEQGFFQYKTKITIPLKAAFFFQLVFAGTAATIVSGAVAERIKLKAFLWFSFFLVALSYPITGHWVWAPNGWLKQLGFVDFAGSTVVHAVGGMAALVGAWLLGPRKYRQQDGQIVSRYKDDGTKEPIFPHNLSMATLGCFILWLGWFGFNGGSLLKVDHEQISHILLTTNIAAATAGLTAAFTTSRLKYFNNKPELSMIINGVLGGLVSITASSAYVELWAALVIGMVAGRLVVLLVYLFNLWKIDDPVGAISVHLGCGIWGTLAVGLFSNKDRLCTDNDIKIETLIGICGTKFDGIPFQLVAQLIGIVAVLGFTFLFSWVTWSILKARIGIRVSDEDELKGLDRQLHGVDAYQGFEKRKV